MKKSFLLAIVMLVLSVSASAQYNGFAFGVKLGPAFDWAGSKTNTIHNEGTRMGFRMGLMGEYYFAENYAITTGLNVNYLRNHFSYDDMRAFPVDTLSVYMLGDVDRYYKGTTFEIPIALKMVTEEFGPFSFFAQVGASVGYSRKDLAKDVFVAKEDANVTYEDDDYVSVRSQYNPFHVGLNAAVGAHFNIKGSTRAFADFFYSRDILNGVKNGIGSEGRYREYYAGIKQDDMKRPETLDFRQNVFGVEVGILF
ncbi:MAG: outer membrane beta-barrel protein [Bacteroidales bacterium]|nr:outer membrane beta-barrel protein [Bacteroidales bacterium]